MRRLRVVHCIYDDPKNPWVGGGGARRVFDLYRELSSTVDATIVTGNYPSANEGTVDGVRVCRVGLPRPYTASRASYAVAAALLLRREAYDVAVVDHSGYAPVFIPRARPIGVVVHHLAGPMAVRRWGTPRGKLIAGLERAALRRGRMFSATSRATAGALERLLPSNAQIAHVASGVPAALFELSRRSASEGIVLYLGRLDILQKGLDVLLDAFAIVIREEPTARLRLAGRGPDADRLRAMAVWLGIEHALEFLGAVTESERDTLLAEATLQVMPSRFEGFGIAAAEALAAGVPLIVSDDIALMEMVAPQSAGGKNVGLIVPRNDTTALAEAMLSLLRQPALRRRFALAGRSAAERFRWDKIAAAHLAFLERVAASATKAPTPAL